MPYVGPRVLAQQFPEQAILRLVEVAGASAGAGTGDAGGVGFLLLTDGCLLFQDLLEEKVAPFQRQLELVGGWEGGWQVCDDLRVPVKTGAHEVEEDGFDRCHCWAHLPFLSSFCVIGLDFFVRAYELNFLLLLIFFFLVFMRENTCQVVD